MEQETFFTLMRSASHWEFELFLMFLFDVILGAILLPRLKRWKTHHTSDDDKIAVLEQKVARLEKLIEK